MIFKIALEIEGDLLDPENLVPNLSNELVVDECFKPTDAFMKNGKPEQYGFGGIYLMHPKKICSSDDMVEAYENVIIQFLKNNYQRIVEYGGTDICIAYEVYFTGDNFNVELFDRQQLKIITGCNARLSFSGYQMTEAKIKEVFSD